MALELAVWLFGDRVGVLGLREGRLSFRYAGEWLAHPEAVPLSQSLPLRAEPFDDRDSRPFFAGLLPEGQNRRLLARQLQISPHNDLALLDAIGGECAGAVTFLECGDSLPRAGAEQSVRWLSDADLVRLLDDLPHRPLLAGEEGIRLSLAGAQDKVPVVVDGDRIGLPLQDSPSTHILKPAIARVRDSVINEAFCLTLAAHMKLDVARCERRMVEGRAFLLVQRYDRFQDEDGRWRRWHQEDFCQALGVAPEHKYQNEGGPGFREGFALLRRATRPSAPQVLRLLDAAIFHALIGNHDAHGKNFSLLYGGNGTVLAPMYDALCTAVYPQLTPKMAMKIGGRYKFSELEARHWAQFAVEAGLSVAQVRKRVMQVAERLRKVAGQLAMTREFSGQALVGEIVALIGQRAVLTLKRLGGAAEPFSPDPAP